MALPILLSCESISKSYGMKPLFEELSLAVYEGDHIGLVGPNGSGKSTLLKILAGREPPDRGTRTVRRQLRVAYVSQEPSFREGHTVEDVLTETLLADGYDPHEEASRVARALGIGGFSRSDHLVSTLSGGWRKRLAIAQAVMLEPDMLLMDEPTNHLDIDGILWLETILKNEPRAFLTVSHDRRFLESVASRVIELNRCYAGGILETKGRYSDFLEQREMMLQTQADRQASLANRVRQEIEWLRRGPKARTTKAKARIESAGKMIDALEAMKDRGSSATAGIDFTASGRRSKQFLVARQISKSFSNRPIVPALDFTLGPGRRLGLLGPNGSGKTTLLKLLAGTVQPDSGAIVRADRLRVVSFEQHRDSLDQTLSLKQALAPAGDAVIYQDRSVHLASWAKRFLFRPEQLALPVARLSGGEQARLLIARLMLQPADLLLLDEPTNDLDLATLDILETSLLEFPGALVLVTHDRWLLDRVSTELLAFDGAGHAEWFADYSQWEAAQERARHRVAEQVDRPRPREHKEPIRQLSKGLSYREQQEWSRIEQMITQAENEVTACRVAVDDPSIISDAKTLQSRCEALSTAEARVEQLYARWAELEAKREQIHPR